MLWLDQETEDKVAVGLIATHFFLYWVSTLVLRNVTWSMDNSSVNMMMWCYSLIVGDVSVVYLAMVPDYSGAQECHLVHEL